MEHSQVTIRDICKYYNRQTAECSSPESTGLLINEMTGTPEQQIPTFKEYLDESKSQEPLCKARLSWRGGGTPPSVIAAQRLCRDYRRMG